MSVAQLPENAPKPATPGAGAFVWGRWWPWRALAWTHHWEEKIRAKNLWSWEMFLTKNRDWSLGIFPGAFQSALSAQIMLELQLTKHNGSEAGKTGLE